MTVIFKGKNLTGGRDRWTVRRQGTSDWFGWQFPNEPLTVPFPGGTPLDIRFGEFRWGEDTSYREFITTQTYEEGSTYIIDFSQNKVTKSEFPWLGALAGAVGGWLVLKKVSEKRAARPKRKRWN